VADESKIDRQLSEATSLAMKVSSMGRAARSQAGIKVRQPLQEAIISVASPKEQRYIEQLKPQILEEINVKNLKFDSLGNVTRLDGKGYSVVGLDLGKKEMLAPKSGGAYRVAVATEIPPELRMEGIAREIVRRLQAMRRSAGFDIADRIVTYYQGEGDVGKAMEGFADYIKQETLSLELVEGTPPEGAFTDTHKLGGYEILLGVKREHPG
jgi:isoleucyl-tRNA synthetase